MKRLVDRTNHWFSQQHHLLPAYIFLVGVIELIFLTKPF